MRTACLPVLLALPACLLLGGCATRLGPVREFGTQAQRLAEAFEPLPSQSLEHCRQQAMDRRVYAAEAPAARFDAASAWREAVEVCRPLEQAAVQLRPLARALDDYGRRLAELAADGLPRSLDRDHGALAQAWASLDDAPKARLDAVEALARFLSRRALAQSQREAVLEALSHEQAIVAIVDTLAVVAQRLHRATLQQRLDDLPSLEDAVRAGAGAPVSVRWHLRELHRQGEALKAQQALGPRLAQAVARLKSAMRELRQQLEQGDDAAHWAEVEALAREIRALRESLARGF